MNPLTAACHAYLRWRHSRGFGVHSPFAYDLVKMAVRPGDYEFYGYADIDDVVLAPGFKGYPEARSDARLLLRLLVQLRTRRLLLPKGLPAMQAAAEAASVPVVTYQAPALPTTPATAIVPLPEPEPGDMIVAPLLNLDKNQLAGRLQADTVVLALHPDAPDIETIYKACGDRGLIFHGTRLLLAVPRKEMAFVAYTMKF